MDDSVRRHSSSLFATGKLPLTAAEGPVSHPITGTRPAALARTTRNCRLLFTLEWLGVP